MNDESKIEAVQKLFDRHGLRVVVIDPPKVDNVHFGNFVGKWRIGSLIVQIVCDRLQWFADLAPSSDPHVSYGLDDVVVLLKNESGVEFPPSDPGPLIDELPNNLEEIEALFSPEHFSSTRFKLDRLIDERTAKVFGVDLERARKLRESHAQNFQARTPRAMISTWKVLSLLGLIILGPLFVLFAMSNSMASFSCRIL